MNFRDIVGVVICAGVYILPISIVCYFLLSKLRKDLKQRRKVKLSDQLSRKCKTCVSSYLGADYLYHCDVVEELGSSICNPDQQQCWRRKRE